MLCVMKKILPLLFLVVVGSSLLIPMIFTSVEDPKQMNQITEKIQEELSAKHSLERINLGIDLLGKVGGEGTILFKQGGSGTPFEFEQHSPTMKADDNAMKEIQRLRGFQAQSTTDKDRAFYSAKIAEIVGAVVTVRVNLPKDEYETVVTEIEEIIEEAKRIGNSNT